MQARPTLKDYSEAVCAAHAGGGLFAHVLAERLPRLTGWAQEEVEIGGLQTELERAEDVVRDVHLLYSMYAAQPVADNPFYTVLRSLAMCRKDDLNQRRWSPRLAVAWCAALVLEGFGRELGDLRTEQIMSCDTGSVMLSRRLQAIGDYLGFEAGSEHQPGSPTTSPLDLLERAQSGALTPSQELRLVHSLPNLIELLQRGDLHLDDAAIFSLATGAPTVALHLIATLATIRSPLIKQYLGALLDLPLDLKSVDLVLGLAAKGDELAMADVVAKRDVVRPAMGRWIAQIEVMRGEQEEEARAVAMLCYFVTRLLDTAQLDGTDDLDTAEAKAFALAHSRFAMARDLYARLVAGAG